MKIDYLAYSIDEFYNLGILDAITNGKNAANQIREILKPILPEEGIEKRVQTYEFGYKVGLIEVLSTPLGEDVTIGSNIQKLILK